jgi:hypothetical protein
MTPDLWITILISICTFITSIGASAFIAGIGWGKVQGDIKSLNEKVARIEGMFTLTLRDTDDIKRH